jgi:hypothetical protein
MLAARLSWLETRPRWVEGRVAFLRDTAGTGTLSPFIPTGADFDRAEHTLHRLGGYPFASEAVHADMGGRHAYHARITDRLRLAKRLSTCDLNSPDRRTVSDWVCCLLAEALCENLPPTLPSRQILAAARRSDRDAQEAETALAAMENDPLAPAEGRALAALLRGALCRDRETGVSSSHPAFRYGRNCGYASLFRTVPPALLALLLREEGGEERTDRLSQALAPTAPENSLLSPDALWSLRAVGVSSEQVVRLVEAGHAVEQIADSLLRRHACYEQLPDAPAWRYEREWEAVREERRAFAAELRATRQEIWEELLPLLRQSITETARAGEDAVELLDAVSSFTTRVFKEKPPTPCLRNAFLDPLTDLLGLPVSLRLSALRFLTEKYTEFWPWDDAPVLRTEGRKSKEAARAETYVNALGNWLRQQRNERLCPFIVMLRSTGDLSLAGEVQKRDLLPVLRPILVRRSVEQIRLIVRLASSLDSREVQISLCRFMGTAFTSARQARQALAPVYAALQTVEEPRRTTLLGTWLDGDLSRLSPAESRAALDAVGPLLPRLVELDNLPLSNAVEPDWQRQKRQGFGWTLAAELARRFPDTADACLRRTIAAIPPDTDWEDGYKLEALTLSLVLLSEGSPDNLTNLFLAVLRTVPESVHGRWIRGVPKLLLGYSSLRSALTRSLLREPRRTVTYLERLGWLFGDWSEQDDNTVLRLWDTVDETAEGTVETDDAGWRDVLDAIPDQTGNVAAFWHARWVCGASVLVPPGIRDALCLPERLTQEAEHLAARFPDLATAPPGISARLSNIRARLMDTDRLRAVIAEEVRERLETAADRARMDAIQQTIAEGLRGRLERLLGLLPANIPLDAEVENALILHESADDNRRPLSRLLRAYLYGQSAELVHRHAGNRTFREGMAARGVDVDCWLAENPRLVRLTNGRRIRLYFETEPLRVLQMGNYFGTCLSADGINAFSTVTNAWEQNKRVLWARDAETGAFLARKLIGINTDGALVGFFTYVASEKLGDNTKVQEMRMAIRGYLHDFAERCHLTQAETGTVPTLFLKRWYDDGVVPWNDSEEAADDEVVMAEAQPQGVQR